MKFRFFLGISLMISLTGCVTIPEDAWTEDFKTEFIDRCIYDRGRAPWLCECVVQEMSKGRNNFEAAFACIER